MTFFWERDGVIKDSNGRTPEEAIEYFRNREIKPVFTYAVSSIERNMFLAHIKEAISLSKISKKEEEKLLEKANKMLELTPYTNWSGD